MRLRSLTASVCALALIVPAAASAQRGGGFHGSGGFHGGGFHGGYGGYHGGFYRGGFYHGYGFGRFGYGFYPFYGFGLGFGLASLYAYDFYSPWNYYYPAGWYGDDYGYGGYGYGGYDGSPYPQVGGDAWSQESAVQSAAPIQGNVSTGPAPCGRYVWNAAQSRYHWDDSGC